MHATVRTLIGASGDDAQDVTILDTEASPEHLTRGTTLHTELMLTVVALLERLRAFGFDGSDPGGLYRTLRKLEDDEFVRSAWEASEAGPHLRIYEITRPGMEELHHRAKGLASALGTLDTFLVRYEEFVALRSSALPARA